MMLDARPRPLQFTIARLMIAIACFGLLFALPSVVAMMLACIAVPMLFAWASASLVFRLTISRPEKDDRPVNVPALAIVSASLDGLAWVALILTLSLGPYHQSGPLYTAMTTLVPVSFLLGTIAFVVALAALVAGGSRSTFRWRILAFFVSFTSAPLYMALAIGSLTITVSFFH